MRPVKTLRMSKRWATIHRYITLDVWGKKWQSDYIFLGLNLVENTISEIIINKSESLPTLRLAINDSYSWRCLSSTSINIVSGRNSCSLKKIFCRYLLRLKIFMHFLENIPVSTLLCLLDINCCLNSHSYAGGCTIDWVVLLIGY